MDLQLTWFILVGFLLAGYAVLDGFDLGAGLIYHLHTKNDGERSLIRTSIGPVWDGNEVWLVTGAGALFAAFPLAYAMVFSGFYMAIMLVLLGFILRAVSLEFRHRDERFKGVWNLGFVGGSFLPALLFGVAVGNIVRGVPMNAAGDFTGSFWSLLNPYALLVGATGLVMFLSHGAHWLALKTEGGFQRSIIAYRSRTHWVFVGFVVATTLYTALAERRHMTTNLHRWEGWVALALLVGGIVWSRRSMMKKEHLAAFVGSAASIVGLVGLAAVGNYPNIVPARGSAAATSLTVTNAASSVLTLKVMLVIAAIGMPIVIAYSAWVYRQFRGKVRMELGQY
jgi:cytochrome d ubiquinol oxidase subunit II